MDDSERAKLALLSQNEVTKKLRQQRDELFFELQCQWEANDKNLNSAQTERERHLKDRYRNKVDELMDAVHTQNILVYRWLEVVRPEYRSTGDVDEHSSLLRKKND